MDISIIVPVYNVEKYLVRCLNSIFKQQFSGTLEVIAVDDGSTDNSLQLLYEYQKDEIRLIIIKHECNKKLSIARSSGIKVATGSYIMHVDSDDWILPGALENLFRKCIESDADVLVFNYESENTKGQRSPGSEIKEEYITTDKLRVQKYFLGATVNKIVKHKHVLKMISGKIGINTTEDLLYSTEILLRADKIYLYPEVFYIYFTNIASITWTISANQLLQNQIVILQEINKIVSDNHASSQFINNIYNYIEKSMLVVIFQTNFIKGEKIKFNNDLIKSLEYYSQINNHLLKTLSFAMKYKYFSILPTCHYLGIKTIMYTFIQSFKINVLKKSRL